MTTGVLALIIVTVILAQIAIFVLPGFYRRKNQLKKISADVIDTANTITEATMDETVVNNHWEGFKEFIVQNRIIEDTGNSVCSFHLIPADGKPLPLFKPGQYLTFKLDIKDPVTKTIKPVIRSYTISDSPHSDYFRVSIKRALAPSQVADAAPGLVSSYFHDRIKKDHRILVKAPSGQFHLEQDEAFPIVLIGGGIGITPMLSIINTLLEAGSKRDISLFYGVRNSSEHVMKEHLQTLAQNHSNFHLHVCYSAALEEDVEGMDYQHQGRVDMALLRSTLKLMRYQFYICGPGPMMETMVPGLKDWGVDSKDIYYESFGPSSLNKSEKTKPVQPATSVTINFSKSSKTIEWDNSSESLLEFAESHNIEVDSACRSGSCGGCQTEITAGDITYSQQPDAEVAAGHCLLCISTPKNDLVLNA